MRRGDLPPHEMVEHYLRAPARECLNKDHPSGCMIAVGSLHSAPDNEQTSAIAAAAPVDSLKTFVAKLEEAEEQGHFADRIDAMAIGQFYTTIVQGLAVQAIDGATLDQLDAIVDMALRARPQTRS